MTPKTFDPTKPVQLRDGTAARIVSTTMGTDELSDYPIGAIITEDGSDRFVSFTSDGREWASELLGQPGDLVNIVETVTKFVNLGNSYRSAEGARAAHSAYDVVKIVREVDGPVLSAEIVEQ